MHASAMAAAPALIYFNPVTLAAIERVRLLRKSGTQAYVTIDAGPHVKVLSRAGRRRRRVARPFARSREWRRCSSRARAAPRRRGSIGDDGARPRQDRALRERTPFSRARPRWWRRSIAMSSPIRAASLRSSRPRCARPSSSRGATRAPWFDARALRDGATDRKLGLGSSAAILVASLAALELDAEPSLDDAALARRVFDAALCCPSDRARRRQRHRRRGQRVRRHPALPAPHRGGRAPHHRAGRASQTARHPRVGKREPGLDERDAGGGNGVP